MSVVGALAVWRSRARGRARAVVSMSSPARVAATTIEDVDAATLGKVLERLDDPADVVAFAASNRHLAAAADEPAWRAKFAASWDDPTFPVASYRELLLARHRALGAVSLGSALSPDATTPAPDFATLAAACDELARAVHASARRANGRDAARRAPSRASPRGSKPQEIAPSPSAAPSARRAVVSASAPRRRRPPRGDGRAPTRSRTVAATSPAPPRGVLAVPRRRPPDRASPVRPGWWDWCAGGATAPPDWEAARGGFEREDDPRPPAPAVDALAAAMGAAPPPPPRAGHPARPAEDRSRARAHRGPARDAGGGARGRERSGRRSTRTRGRSSRAVVLRRRLRARHRAVAPRRPPPSAGAEVRRAVGAPPPPTTASMSGAWFGRRMTVTTRFPAATGSRRTLDPPAVDVSLDAAFRLALTATPEGALGGWMKDTVGDATRGARGPCFSRRRRAPTERAASRE